jgi:CRP-like cAMP-binding protein
MDLLARAAALAACPLFEDLAPAVIVRLAERARASALERGERRSTDDTVWVVARGRLAVAVRQGADQTASLVRKHGADATAGSVLGVIHVVRAQTPVVEIVAVEPSELVELAADDARDVLEEDPAALTALANRLATLLADTERA